MSDYSIWKREEAKAKKREGLTGRGIVGCISFIASVGLGYLAYRWLDNEYNITRLFAIPKDWPGWVVDALGIILMIIVVQAVFIAISSLVWRLAGKDKKVDDMMDDLLEKWDEIEN